MNEIISIVSPAIPQTLILVGVSSLIAVIFGMPLGIILMMTRSGGLSENPKVYSILDSLVNFLRSVPFVILMLILTPLMRLIVGKAYGTAAAIVPLSIAAIPFMGRLAEGYLVQVDKGILEAAKSMGSTNAQIIYKVLIPEAMPSIVNGITMMIINIIGYSAMAGAIGGGGLGEIAIRYGYTLRRTDILWVTVILIVLFVQVIQFVGVFLEKKIDKK
ncbi:methionine ABC transporter permease [Anaerosphaera multitolerans]|uniref:ABC transporter permease n=1 Tax=Anaerosphaera multitolerans TaxID=2487351 RepID=A0A437S7I4_9FIRM|nr:methionine ABC transporter permease [Anaerosphaera multitolerans]RVU55040.1 ABC transporter permease [Anaerosphaera multitolerans]